MNRQLIKWLFETEAFKVCPPGKPFWYTSGKIGPYYINTHFLYGGENKAGELLSLINAEKENKLTCTSIVFEKVLENYKKNKTYKGVIDKIVEHIAGNRMLEGMDYISGGERRDWYFSLLPAFFLEKKHITLFKDNDALLFNKNKSCKINNLEGAEVLHIADIITEASSYERAWVPAVKGINGKIGKSMVVIDRLQGGAEKLSALGIESHCLLKVDLNLFGLARELGIIKKEDFNMLCDYYNDPVESMREFLLKNPSFIKNALQSDEKTASRAKLCMEENFYSI